MCELGDSILIEKLKHDDEKAFHDIYEKFHRIIFRLALKYIRDRKSAEDTVHDVFVKLWDYRGQLRRGGSLKNFLLKTTKNHVLNQIKREKVGQKNIEAYNYERKCRRTQPENVIRLADYQRVHQHAIQQLPEKRREIYKLRLDDGLTNAEIAAYLGVSIHTVKSQFYKAKQDIRGYISKVGIKRTGS